MPDQCDQTRVPKSRWAPKTLEKAKLVKKIRRKYELTIETILKRQLRVVQ